ncbi:MAG: radical SAM protein, partial [Candidatus Bathyarchaeota archaeon]|nr:radical SAM protein [Candidatus Bathyarchaeota archaeon]
MVLDRVRVSLGSAVVLDLIQGKVDVMPTTLYLMTYHPGKCDANCAFCPQARTTRGRADMLSRVTWPPFPTKKVVSGVRMISSSGLVKRLCIQAMNYGEVFKDTVGLVTKFKECSDTPISVCCQPLNATRIKELAEAGVDRICFAVDAVTRELFDRVKGRGVG